MTESLEESIGRLAVAHGMISEAELRVTLKEVAQKGLANAEGALGRHLVEIGALTSSQLERISEAAKAATVKVPRVGQYRLLSKLGAGGMGAVYKAQNESDGKIVALKILPRSKAVDEEFLTRFQQEAQAAFDLKHPNIVRAFDVGHADGYHYIAMEYVQGKDLYAILEKRGKLPIDEALQIIIQMAKALEHAHSLNLVHRDIKPDNILIDQHGQAKLTDLGLVMEEAPAGGTPRLTKRGMAMGTPFYFSPEQARGETDIDTRSDIYALGATFYEMVTGKPPFEGESAAEVMMQHIQSQVISPKEIDKSLPDGVCRIIEKMMTKDREDRYQEPEELLVDLRLVAAGEPPKNSDIKPWASTVSKATGTRRRLAPINLKELPALPGQTGKHRRATRRATRIRRSTRGPGRLHHRSSWVIILIVLILLTLALGVGFFLFGTLDQTEAPSNPDGSKKTPGSSLPLTPHR